MRTRTSRRRRRRRRSPPAPPAGASTYAFLRSSWPGCWCLTSIPAGTPCGCGATGMSSPRDPTSTPPANYCPTRPTCCCCRTRRCCCHSRRSAASTSAPPPHSLRGSSRTYRPKDPPSRGWHPPRLPTPPSPRRPTPRPPAYLARRLTPRRTRARGSALSSSSAPRAAHGALARAAGSRPRRSSGCLSTTCRLVCSCSMRSGTRAAGYSSPSARAPSEGEAPTEREGPRTLRSLPTARVPSLSAPSPPTSASISRRFDSTTGPPRGCCRRAAFSPSRCSSRHRGRRRTGTACRSRAPLR